MPATALSTDLYELTMAAGYYVAGVKGRATFELFVRELPPHRSYLIAAGLEQAIEYLEAVRFAPDEIEHLRRLANLHGVPSAFFDTCLRDFRFAGEVWAVEEGTPIFPHEPFLRVTAPLIDAQLVETALLAIVTFQTSIASKAARVVRAAAGRAVAEFGTRRAHGVEAGMLAARAAYLAGCDSTSNVEAGFRFGIPVSGTMAHSWVMTFEDEIDAFRRYTELFGDRAILLIDTYDTAQAARKIVTSGLRPAAVRMDSGRIEELSREVRRILDAGGLGETKIFVSGDLDEYRIAQLVDEGAPLDAFGVGTAMSTSKDAPALGGVYKLVEVERGGRMVRVLKLSPGKASYPGAKQAWRVMSGGGADHDVLALADEQGPPGAVPLLRRVMAAGRRVAAARPLAELRSRCLELVAGLPDSLKRIDETVDYPVQVSNSLQRLAQQLSTRAER
jgi:nicotinate phosphoribosyltransferase